MVQDRTGVNATGYCCHEPGLSMKRSTVDREHNLPVDGGRLAIVGNRDEPLDAMERRLRVQFRSKDV